MSYLENSVKSVAVEQEITPYVCVKSFKGLGELVCLVPVLDRLYSEGCQIRVVTRPEWVHTFGTVRPEFFWSEQSDNGVVDLDELVDPSPPSRHRTDEFGLALGLGRPFPSPHLNVPTIWSKPFENLRDSVVFAPESSDFSLRWPARQARSLWDQIKNDRLVLIGAESDYDIPCDTDLRGQLELYELFGLLSVVDAVVTTDPAILQMAAAVNTPTVALLGGADPGYHIRLDQRVVVIMTELACYPCNKLASCTTGYRCITDVSCEDIIRAIRIAQNIDYRFIYKIDPACQK